MTTVQYSAQWTALTTIFGLVQEVSGAPRQERIDMIAEMVRLMRKLPPRQRGTIVKATRRSRSRDILNLSEITLKTGEHIPHLSLVRARRSPARWRSTTDGREFELPRGIR